VARLYVEIDNINDFLVGFYFIKSIDRYDSDHSDLTDLLFLY
jgi:hypothetical protein